VKSERLKNRNQNKAIVVCLAGTALVRFLPPSTNGGHLGARADPWNYIASTATALECFLVSLEGLHFNCRPRSGRVETKMCTKCATGPWMKGQRAQRAHQTPCVPQETARTRRQRARRTVTASRRAELGPRWLWPPRGSAYVLSAYLEGCNECTNLKREQF